MARSPPALRAAGVSDVAVPPGHGPYQGAPQHDPFDAVNVTSDVAGVSPHWLDQLAPRGRLIAPIAHGGARRWPAPAAHRVDPSPRLGSSP
ncbi:hypothetical protein [Allostreptomyces psammosilenae]|uniref:Protein-L-isoaspartate O-methyltransferase n=1 Tax=Allostreptomyces psammosilenae TaxID=1892865 RepID=A0A852ZZK4_9ACTN|nr:hypothetical protein [Allostreptomyces psammosilenae]NYI07803.1 protein-L-isoaspartate O-methyltransferase [Allostreptomyces psammosilenae]